MTETKNTKAFYNTEIPSDWEALEFGNIFSFLKSFSFSREQLSSEPTKDGIRNIHYGDIHATYENEILDLEIEKSVPYLNDGLIDPRNFDDENYPALKEGDLIIADASEDYEGVCDCVELRNINGAKIVSGLHTFAARTSDEIIALGYRTYSLKHEQVIRELRRIATGTSVYGVSKTNLSKLKIPLPPLLEQRAIAQVLSTADAAMHTTEKLIAQKELRKKWLMQQLLSGKKRLKGFGGEWKENQLGDLGDSYNGLTGKTKENFGSGFPFITYMNVFSNSQIDIAQVDRVVIEENENQNTVKYGDFFFTVSSETPNEVGMASVLLDEVENLYLNSFCFGFRLFDFETLNPKYAQFLLRFSRFREAMCLLAQGSTRFNISKTGVKQILLALPPIKEQTAIAQVLQAADKEISLLKAKAAKLREQKKGLMQQLLTGKKRLNLDSLDLGIKGLDDLKS